ncbi:Uncharacterised protein [Bordetella pertussis]|nr:Uncharacterised protein [Bordetella pertussis]
MSAPSLPMTRWHGTMRAMGLAALAPPMARAAWRSSCPSCRASAP